MFNLFRFCRKNRSTCSIRQCCFDIVAGVDGTLCTSTVWVAMIIICMRQTRRRRCANCSSSYCRPCRRRRYPTVDPMTYYFRCDYRDIFALAWTAVTLSHYRDHVPVASASRRVLCNYSPPPWFAEGGKQAAHGARTSRCLFRRVISVLMSTSDEMRFQSGHCECARCNYTERRRRTSSPSSTNFQSESKKICQMSGWVKAALHCNFCSGWNF